MPSEDFSAVPPSSAVLVPCNPGCRYAEPMRGNYADWIWCQRPGATVRVRSMAFECRWFAPVCALPDEPSSSPQ